MGKKFSVELRAIVQTLFWKASNGIFLEVIFQTLDDGYSAFYEFRSRNCSYILIYRFDISSIMSVGASGSLSSLYGSECSLNHKRKNSLSKYSGSCPAFMRSA